MNTLSLNSQSTLKQRIDNMRLRIFAGENINYEHDALALLALRTQAQHIGDTDLELFAINVYGVLHAVLGQLDEAQQIYSEGALLALRWDNLPRWVNFQLNLGTIYGARGEPKAARETWESLLPAFRSMPREPETCTRKYMLYVNIAGACATLKDYDCAKRYAHLLLNQLGSPEVALVRPERLPELVGRAREALASAHFARGEYKQARAQADLLHASFRSSPLLPLATAARLTFVRLAVFDPADGYDPEIRWREFCDSIAPGLATRDRVLWSLAKVDLPVEMRLYRERQRCDWAQRCGQKAIEILTLLGDEEQRQFVQAMLTTP